jgi:hypothetical protein
MADQIRTVSKKRAAEQGSCARRSDTPKEITAKRTDSPSPGGRTWGALGIDHEALDRAIGTGRGELEGQALTAGSLVVLLPDR